MYRKRKAWKSRIPFVLIPPEKKNYWYYWTFPPVHNAFFPRFATMMPTLELRKSLHSCTSSDYSRNCVTSPGLRHHHQFLHRYISFYSSIPRRRQRLWSLSKLNNSFLLHHMLLIKYNIMLNVADMAYKLFQLLYILPNQKFSGAVVVVSVTRRDFSWS